MGGIVHGTLKVDATHPVEPSLALNAQANGLDLSQLLAAGGSPRQVKGGKTDVTINVTTRGTTERQWAQHASGNVLAVVGPAQVANSKETDSGLGRIAQAVNPLRGAQAETELKCVVIRLPLHDGIAHVDHSIAAETREIGVLASGTIDLRNETLDLSITPRTRIALPVDLGQVASLVHVSGRAGVAVGHRRCEGGRGDDRDAGRCGEQGRHGGGRRGARGEARRRRRAGRIRATWRSARRRRQRARPPRQRPRRRGPDSGQPGRAQQGARQAARPVTAPSGDLLTPVKPPRRGPAA